MAWRHGRYYEQSQRIGRRVVTRYIGGGLVGALAAQLDQAEWDERAEAREARRQLLDQARPPAAMVEYAAGVRTVVAQVLTSLGFHQHKRQWRMRRMAEPLDRALTIYRKPKPTKAELDELRLLVNTHTNVARLGDMARMAEQSFLAGYRDHPATKAAIGARCSLLAMQLGYAESTELERLLINEVVLCWIDHYRIVTVHAQQTEEFKFADMEAWERILTSKQRRYLRAVEALARVRRLLKLPAVQVNVALDGGQQVNISQGG